MTFKHILPAALALLFLGSVTTKGWAQTEAELYKKGLEHRKSLNLEEGLKVFKQLYEMDSKNVDYAHYLSFFYSKVVSDHVKLVVLLGTLALGMLGVLVLDKRGNLDGEQKKEH